MKDNLDGTGRWEISPPHSGIVPTVVACLVRVYNINKRQDHPPSTPRWTYVHDFRGLVDIYRERGDFSHDVLFRSES